MLRKERPHATPCRRQGVRHPNRSAVGWGGGRGFPVGWPKKLFFGHACQSSPVQGTLKHFRPLFEERMKERQNAA
jgi:hypothetical protein